jgi:hypothetical protein
LNKDVQRYSNMSSLDSNVEPARREATKRAQKFKQSFNPPNTALITDYRSFKSEAPRVGRAGAGEEGRGEK